MVEDRVSGSEADPAFGLRQSVAATLANGAAMLRDLRSLPGAYEGTVVAIVNGIADPGAARVLVFRTAPANGEPVPHLFLAVVHHRSWEQVAGGLYGPPVRRGKPDPPTVGDTHAAGRSFPSTRFGLHPCVSRTSRPSLSRSRQGRPPMDGGRPNHTAALSLAARHDLAAVTAALGGVLDVGERCGEGLAVQHFRTPDSMPGPGPAQCGDGALCGLGVVGRTVALVLRIGGGDAVVAGAIGVQTITCIRARLGRADRAFRECCVAIGCSAFMVAAAVTRRRAFHQVSVAVLHFVRMVIVHFKG